MAEIVIYEPGEGNNESVPRAAYENVGDIVVGRGDGQLVTIPVPDDGDTLIADSSVQGGWTTGPGGGGGGGGIVGSYAAYGVDVTATGAQTTVTWGEGSPPNQGDIGGYTPKGESAAVPGIVFDTDQHALSITEAGTYIIAALVKTGVGATSTHAAVAISVSQSQLNAQGSDFTDPSTQDNSYFGVTKFVVVSAAQVPSLITVGVSTATGHLGASGTISLAELDIIRLA